MGCINAKAATAATSTTTAPTSPRLLGLPGAVKTKSSIDAEDMRKSCGAVDNASSEDSAGATVDDVLTTVRGSKTRGPWTHKYRHQATAMRARLVAARARAAAARTLGAVESWAWSCERLCWPLGAEGNDQEEYPMWTSKQIAKHYDFPHTTGHGAKVAIIALDAKLTMEELREDFEALGLPMPRNIQLVDVGKIPSHQEWSGNTETLLDLEVIGGICPDAAITVYRAANTGLQPFADAVQKAVDDGNGVVSISWGMAENSTTKHDPLNNVLKRAAAAGVTVCVASGDDGARDDAKSGAHCDFPAASPLVLACGGTELMSSGEEHVWNNISTGGGGGGGGVSNVFSRPTWQQNLAVVPVSGRIVPDVAGLAAGGDWLVAVDGKCQGVGGTSAVAPLWAALMTLANEQRAHAGKGTVGFVNVALYERARTDQSSLFVDITEGNNRPGPSQPGYDAQIGFDACTGWGIPQGAAICTFLSNLP